jgi:hypothetical protein
VRSHAKASSAGSSTRWAKGLGSVVRGAIAERDQARRDDGSSAPSRTVLLILAIACALGLLAAPAGAALPTHSELPALNQTGFKRLCGIAVDAQGNRYLSDADEKKVEIFSPSGSPITSFEPSANNLEPEHGPCALAVDSQGNVYVNGRNADVAKYKPSTFPPTSSTTYSVDKSIGETSPGAEDGSGVLATWITGINGVGVDPATDDVYVPLEGHISAFHANGEVISETIGEDATGGASFSSVAVSGTTGKIYAYAKSQGKAYVLSPDGSQVLTEVNGSATKAGSFGTGARELALDQSNGHFYVADVGGATGHKVIDEFDSGGGLVSEIPTPATLLDAGQSAVAVDNSGTENKGDVFFSAGVNPSSMFAYGPLAYAKKPSIEEETVRPFVTTATLEAQINPNGQETTYQFEYLSEDAYQANGESFSGPEEATKVPTSPEAIGNGEGAVAVSVEIDGLTEGSSYRFRVIATNPTGETPGKAVFFKTYLAPSVFKPCANDALRTGPAANLPDCRAYEQASPLNKNGGDVTGTFLASRAASGGSRVSFVASAPLPGAEGAQNFFPQYLASRGANGWSTHGLLPPQSEGQEALAPGWNSDLSHVYSWAEKLGEPGETAFLDRDTSTGSITTMIPHFPGVSRNYDAPTFPGSSEDGSVVLIEAGAEPLLEGAVKGKRNLYVWDRATGITRLAGVLNDGKSPPSGAMPGPYDWLNERPSQGGVRARYYTVDPHAISRNGSRVYFTAAGSGQLYLRQNPTQQQSKVTINDSGEEECTQPELACTIRISASQKHNGAGPEGSDAAGAKPAAFMAASADGSQAFFTSSEMLTNVANTGTEQPPAQIGRAKIGVNEGEEIKSSFLPKHAVGVATSPDGKYLYWADPVGGLVGRARLNGDGSATEINDRFIEPGPTEFELNPRKEPGILTSAPARPRYVAVDSNYVYWTNSGPLVDEGQGPQPVAEAGTVGRAKLDDSGNIVPDSVEPEFIAGASNPQGLAVNSEHIYWANSGNGYHFVGRATIGGGVPNQSFINLGTGGMVTGLAITPSNIFVVLNNKKGNNFSQIASYSLDSGEPSGGLFLGHDAATALVVGGSFLYWSTGEVDPDSDFVPGEVPPHPPGTYTPFAPAIGRISLDEFQGPCYENPTCDKEFLTPGTVLGLAFDGIHLYWSVNGEPPKNPGNDLYRYNSETGKLTDLVADHSPGDPNGAEVISVVGTSDDGSYVYFVANGALSEGATRGDCPYPIGNVGQCNLYVEHDSEINFIARLLNGGAEGDDGDWWPASASETGSNKRKYSRVSADGRTLLFRSQEKLTAYENEETPEFYLYRFGDSEPIICITCNPTGLPPSSLPRLESLEPTEAVSGAAQVVATLRRNLSADGNRVFFETAEALLPADVNGDSGCPSVKGVNARACQDVYEWEAKGTGSCESEAQNGGCLYLLSSGTSPAPSFFLDASSSGDDAFIFTRQQLASQDTDSLIDVYDARVGGGLASQNEPPPATVCEGEACKGGASATPESPTPSTPLFSGPGNPKPHHKKAKPRKRKHRHNHKRHAKKNGRAQR